jgi:hypothetical protein
MRQCGDCQLCCKLLPVPEIGKLANTRCRHQRTGKGCALYHTPSLPGSCRLWSCQWLLGDYPGQRPDRVHYVVDCMPDYITVRDNATADERHIPVVQVWVDPGYRDAHRELGLRRWLDETKQVAIVRYNNRDGFILFPPSTAGDGQWHEEWSGKTRAETHDIRDVAEKIGGIAMTIEVSTAEEGYQLTRKMGRK